MVVDAVTTALPISTIVRNGYLPMSNITPFTYRDGATYLESLEQVRLKTNEVVHQFNALIDSVNAIMADQALIRTEMAELESRQAAAMSALSNSVDHRLDLLRQELLNAIGRAMSGVADDPTTGETAIPVSTVISRVYDYARINGRFAGRMDGEEITAEVQDARGFTARHLDLSPEDIIDDDPTIDPRLIETV